jgi:transcriptional regulator of acetoin/glycerol metabolism
VVLIKQSLKKNKGNKTAAARQLGIDKSTLFRKIKAFDIDTDLYS